MHLGMHLGMQINNSTQASISKFSPRVQGVFLGTARLHRPPTVVAPALRSIVG